MAGWNKILVEGDAVANNLATADLTQPSSTNRVYNLNGNTNRVAFKDGIVQFSNSSNSVSHQFDNANGVFDARSASGIRLSDGDNGQYLDLKPKSEISASYTITFPNAAPGAANKILEANATGDLSWIDTPSGGGGVSIDNYSAQGEMLVAGDSSSNIDAESNVTFSSNILTVTGRIACSDLITLSTNNKSLNGTATGGSGTRALIKCNASNNTEVGNSTEKTVLNGSSVDAGSLQFVCGPATMDEIVATNISLSSTGDHGEGSVVTYFDTSASYSTTAGRVYYHTGATTGNKWAFATSSAEAGNKALVGIALGTDQSAGFLLRGFVNPGITMTASSQCFLATNASITNTVPTSGFSRVMGHSVTTTVMYFNPSGDYLDL